MYRVTVMCDCDCDCYRDLLLGLDWTYAEF